MKIKVRMANGHFADGTPQPLYFPEGHERAGVFKGMATILQERGFGDMSKVRAECKEFKCAPGATDCCCRRILYNQPDFANVPSLLEITCKARGFKVIFLPKFHCELNFIEQCWGYAKRLYRLNPESSREDVLQRNALEALEAIPIDTMRRFANRSSWFMDAYSRGLNGRQAAWAARKYRGHRILPATIMDEVERAHVT
jgi:transposase